MSLEQTPIIKWEDFVKKSVSNLKAKYPSLNLSQIAVKINLNRSTLTRVINEGVLDDGDNFIAYLLASRSTGTNEAEFTHVLRAKGLGCPFFNYRSYTGNENPASNPLMLTNHFDIRSRWGHSSCLIIQYSLRSYNFPLLVRFLDLRDRYLLIQPPSITNSLPLVHADSSYAK